MEYSVPDNAQEADYDVAMHLLADALNNGPGAIPLHGREKRREPCTGCRIDPNKPLEAGNIMATTKDAIGTLSKTEVVEWCSELIEEHNGRCERARDIKHAAEQCKSEHPNDTSSFFQCFAPAFAERTHG